MVEQKMNLYFRNKKRLVGAVCRHVLEHHGKTDKDLVVLINAVEKTISNYTQKSGISGIEIIIKFDPKKEIFSDFIRHLSGDVHIEYTKLIKEKHPHLFKPKKPKSHTRARIH
jgi:hypothetical protein